jgi:hypothetical protein
LSGAQRSDFEWSGQIARGGLIEIRGFNGDVVAYPSTTGNVEVTAQVVDEDRGVSPVSVKLEETDQGVTVCAVMPDDGKCRTPEELSTKGPGARVNFTVRVPEGVGFVGRTVNGGIQAESLASDIEAYTVNGRVRISTTGSAQARTINGSISASLLNPFWRKPPQFQTVNGAITLELPNAAKASLVAETRNGTILSRLPQFSGTVEEHRIAGAVGRPTGRAPLTLKTVNGSIELKPLVACTSEPKS